MLFHKSSPTGLFFILTAILFIGITLNDKTGYHIRYILYICKLNLSFRYAADKYRQKITIPPVTAYPFPVLSM